MSKKRTLSRRCLAFALAMVLALSFMPFSSQAMAGLQLNNEETFETANAGRVFEEDVDITGDFTDINLLRHVRNMLGFDMLRPIYAADVAGITALTIPSGFGVNAVQSLAGLHHFVDMVYLTVHANQISDVDLSALPALESLAIMNNQLTSIDFSPQPGILRTNLQNNNISQIDVSMLDELYWISLANNGLASFTFAEGQPIEVLALTSNTLTSLDISNLPNLRELAIGQSAGLAAQGALNLNNPSLTALVADGMGLTDIDVSGVTALEVLHLQNNNFTSLAFNDNPALRELALGNLWARGQFLTSIDLSANTSLEVLTISESGITNLDLTNNPNLVSVLASANRYMADISFAENLPYLRNVTINGQGQAANTSLTSLTINNAPNLTTFATNSNHNLTYLNLANNPSLAAINALNLGVTNTNNFVLTGSNAIESIQLPGNNFNVFDANILPASVTNISLFNGNLTEFDSSGLINLTRINLGMNNLTSVDFTANAALEHATITDNQITGHVDLTGNPNLWRLWAQNNFITSMDVTGTSLGIAAPEFHLGATFNITNNSMMSLDDIVGWQTRPLVPVFSMAFHPQRGHDGSDPAPNILTTQLPDAFVGVPYQYMLRTDHANLVHWTVADWPEENPDAALTGLQLILNTGTLQGTPTPEFLGTWSFTVRAQRISAGQPIPGLYDERIFTINVREVAEADSIQIAGPSELLPEDYHTLTATFYDEDNNPLPSQSIVWSITGNDDVSTTITDVGLLTIGTNETIGNQITVRAALASNPAVYDQLQVSIDRNITGDFVNNTFLNQARNRAGAPAPAPLMLSNVINITDWTLTAPMIPAQAINNFAGIENFRSLQHLNLNSHGSTAGIGTPQTGTHGIDLSVLPNLVSFTNAHTFLSANAAMQWVIFDNPLLESVNIEPFRPVDIDVSDLAALQSLRIARAPNLTSIDTSQNLALESLALISSPAISALDISANTQLRELSLTGATAQRNVDLSNNVNLEMVHMPGEHLTVFDWPTLTKLANVNVSNNFITSFDATNHPDLHRLIIHTNDMQSTDDVTNWRDTNLLLGDNHFQFFPQRGMALTAPVITTEYVPAVTVGQPVHFVIEHSGNNHPIWYVEWCASNEITAEATGLFFSHQTALLYGTPMPGSEGIWTFTVRAASAQGDYTRTFTLEVLPATGQTRQITFTTNSPNGQIAAFINGTQIQSGDFVPVGSDIQFIGM
ncbi:MAG: putative Ig domain-containing protein, partial [Defluviitaleaceae bacterium]|nr:putative Ig domain-containing protein [Defluviitaleaceae bacterium]